MDRAGHESTEAPVMVSKAEYEKIHLFRFYIDSIAGNPSGKWLYDSILSERPGLMDSIHFIEKIYQLQSLKK